MISNSGFTSNTNISTGTDKNPFVATNNTKHNISPLLSKIFTFCIVGTVLFTACKKEDNLIPSPAPVIANTNDLSLKSTAAPSFWGDWESGTVIGTYAHNWGYEEAVSTDRISLLHDGLGRQGTYYAKVEVRNGDNPLAPSCAGTNRAEVSSMRDANNAKVYETESSGTKQYSFSVKFDNTWKQPVDNGDGNGKYAIFCQLHGPDALGTNPLFALSATDQIRLGFRGGDITTNSKVIYNLSDGSLNIGHWIDFIITIKFAKTATGTMLIQRRNEGATNFTDVLNLTNIPTLQYSPSVNGGAVGGHFMKYGLYRNNQTFTSILYLDGFTESTVTSSGTTTTTANQAPLIQNQAFQLTEKSANGTAAGSVAASDPDAGQSLTYSILSGNTSSAFAINASTGALTVAGSAALNIATNPSFALVVKVLDNGSPALSSQATVTITLKSAGVIVPVTTSSFIVNQTFSLSKYASNGTTVGTVVASALKSGQVLTYSITAGNTSTAFAINSSTGKITVNNKNAFRYYRSKTFQLTVTAKDNSTPTLSSQATITINVQ